jgi:prepilin-type N-terminal cleavage/methylation domain-containing protein/prepilin-type processing-associated H-X9-DG protein
MFSSRFQKRGFTLVELLVVIAIIGVLVALLLPAVQAAREAARRSQCSNHFKQMGLAAHMYHDTYQILPYNGSPQSGSGSTMQRDTSWFFRMLPFMEQKAAFDKWVFSGDTSLQDGTSPNVDIIHVLRVPGLWCPSSSLPRTKTMKSWEVQLPNYVGISGSYFQGGTSATTSTDPYADSYGRTVYNGVVSVARYPVGFQSITDGTSNVMMASEQSDYQRDSTNKKFDRRSSGHWGGAWSCGSGAGNWTQNVTTIRYPIKGGFGAAGNTQPYEVNIPLFSSHPGGVMALLADGSVRFVSQTIDFANLTALADRSDGTPLSDF